ncbi:MAG TPA: ABC transporter permease [Thermoanaerobaculia bacterium]|nr:ABC transporter permease [Thermoanaerobaculia bacterium]
MRSADIVRLRLRSLFRRSAVEAELAAELRFHLDQQIDENIAAGMSPVEARQAALRAFGGVAQIQEKCREARGLRWIEELSQDLGYAVRTFRRSPAFTLVAVLSLALGIGANTAIFSLINALLLRELPVRDPSRLVAVGNPTRVGSLSTGSVRNDIMSFPMYREIRDQNRVFTDVLASGRTGKLSVGIAPAAAGAEGEGETARGRLVSGNYFSVLGVNAIRGRTFTAEDDRLGGAPVVVISHAWWKRRFDLDPGVVGRTITLNGHPFTIIGVTPPGFFGDIVGTASEIWIPLSMQPQVNPGRNFLDRWGTSWLLLMGRLRPGVPIERARAEVNVLFARVLKDRAGSGISQDMLPDPDRMRVEVTPGGAGFSSLRQQLSQPLYTLMAMVALVLLVACANVANLLLERAMARQKEIAVRLALGAGKARLIRQLLTESVLLSLLGGALGLLLAFWAGTALLRLVGGAGSVAAVDLRPDLPILFFTAAVSILTGVLFGLAPALRATRVELAPTLKESARSVAGQAGGRWPLGKLLVIAQFSVSLLLVMGAGLFVRTLRNLERLDLGCARDNLLLVNVDPVAAGYQGARFTTFPRELTERLQALPGVTSVTYSENGIFSGTESATTIRAEGFKAPADGDSSFNYDRVGPGYFQTIGATILRGRDFAREDGPSAPRVAVVNEAMAAQLFAGRDPLGKHVVVEGPPDLEYEIVGVSRNVRDHDLRGPVPPRFYIPLLQSDDIDIGFNVEIRTADPAALVGPVRQAIHDLDPNLPMTNLDPLSSMIDDSIANERIIARLSTVFGSVALLLAAIGLYGVISYTISRRINEIGIRMALGARRSRVLWMVLRETLLLALAGIVLGVPVALGSARAVSSRLFGLSAADPATLSAAVAVLLVVALFAGLVPGSRATRIQPVQALRYE